MSTEVLTDYSLNSNIRGWLVSKKINKKSLTVIFTIKLYDSEFRIRAKLRPELLETAKKLKIEDFVEITIKEGTLIDIKRLSENTIIFPRSPREIVDIFSSSHIDINRHLYLRSPGFRFILVARDILLSLIRKYMREQGFLEVHPPIITQTPLYTDETLIPVKYFRWNAYLSQCVGFYLESLIFAFERVYNISPSFRGEKSKGAKYLNEYWHLKGEAAFLSRDDLIEFINSFMKTLFYRFYNKLETAIRNTEEFRKVAEFLNLQERKRKFENMGSFESITYDEALKILSEEGLNLSWGDSIPEKGEALLGRKIGKLYWIVDFPAKKEPFPYRIHPENPLKTLTADLMSDEFGEVCGIAEKITDIRELERRMEEKGKKGDERYRFVVELRKSGIIPHSGFGMGIERLLRLLLGLPHVKYAIPFSRLLRKPYP